MSDDRRAEIEAVMLVLWPEFRVHDTVHRRRANDVIDALDRVRDARGDDEPRTDREKFGTYPSLSAQCADGRHRECFTSQVCRCDCHRSPQDEDHEAGIPYCDVCRCFRPAGQCGFESHGQKRPENCPRSPQVEDHETIRPEQPPPDSLGGQPPAEPETP